MYKKISLGLITSLLALTLSPHSNAQTTTTGDPSLDPFRSASNGDTSGLFNLMHRVQNGAIIDDRQAAINQQKKLQEETQNFRQQQLQLLRQKLAQEGKQ